MSEREDWHADSEGNLSPPEVAKGDTDEFGRDDPAALERERRRRERESAPEGSLPEGGEALAAPREPWRRGR